MKYVLTFDAEHFAKTGEAIITNESNGETLTIDEAKDIAMSGSIVDSSMSFMRLVQFDFDLDSLREFYS